ncbi:hypothetical protein VTN00DRAFT_3950 [Thermoascus crustaceus]|uniref:uncharacterized protein n=1 Tax=Thermoascus crustaceus TaxID=5088 RepID=UPI003744A7BD
MTAQSINTSLLTSGPLPLHLAARNGKFVSGDRHFAATGRNFSIERTPEAVTLKGDLRDYDGEYCSASLNLSVCILNKDGALVLEKQVTSDGFFGRDGPLVQFLEQVTIVGFVVAGIQAIAGNPDHAKRALAYCANSTISCIGVAIGAFFGGPVGAAIGAGIATAIATLTEMVLNALKTGVLATECTEAEKKVQKIILEKLRPSEWVRIDNNNSTVEIVTSGHNLYQRHRNGQIWCYNGSTWDMIDTNPQAVQIVPKPRTVQIVAVGGNLFSWHDNGLAL